MRRTHSHAGLLLIITTVALALAGCNRDTIYHHYKHTPLTGWEKNDTLLFHVPTASRRAVVKRFVEVRIAGDYPFQSINLIVEQTTLPARLFRRDTLNCNLITAGGKIKGEGITLYQYRFALPDISLNEGDSLAVSIHHNMKREILPGIADIGLRLTTY